MSAPVIDPTTSILGYRQWLYWEYQPYASNAPTSWACTGLPPGMSVNATTGKISGAGSVPGIFQASLTATNASGTSSPLVLTIGIEESAILANSAADLTVDLRSGTVVGTSSSSSGSSSSGSSTAQAVLYAKENDDFLLVIRFQKAGSYIDLNLVSLKLGMKELEPENIVVIGGGATSDVDFKKFGSGSGAYYVIPASFRGDALASALSNYEQDYGTTFNALAELEWIEDANWAGVGPAQLRRTSRTFWVTVERDLISENG